MGMVPIVVLCYDRYFTIGCMTVCDFTCEWVLLLVGDIYKYNMVVSSRRIG